MEETRIDSDTVDIYIYKIFDICIEPPKQNGVCIKFAKQVLVSCGATSAAGCKHHNRFEEMDGYHKIKVT